MFKKIFGTALTLCLLTYSVLLPVLVIIDTADFKPDLKLSKGNTVIQPKLQTALKKRTVAKEQVQPPPLQNKEKPITIEKPKTASTQFAQVTQVNPINQVNKATNQSGSPQPVKTTSLTHYQYEMLVRIISAEAKGESLKGQVAVGAVILNRIKSGKFPKTIAANVLKPGEFEPVSNGQIWSAPVPSAYRAAQLALNGWDPTYGALYFYNPAKTSSRWIWSRPTILRIGDHVFAG